MTRLGVMSSSLGYLRLYKLVTVSKHPEKATIMVKRLAEMLDDRYIVIHAANCERKCSVPKASARTNVIRHRRSQIPSTRSGTRYAGKCHLAGF